MSRPLLIGLDGGPPADEDSELERQEWIRRWHGSSSIFSGTEGTSGNPMDITLPFADNATYTDGENNQYDYQTGPQGDLTFWRTPADGESHYFRDADGLLTKLVLPHPSSGEGNEQIFYVNDADGNRTKATYPDSSEEVWTYATDGTLTSYTDQLGRTTG